MKDQIVLCKLVSGEMVIGRYTDIHKEFLNDVHSVMISPSETGQIGLSLLPFMMPFDKQGTSLNSSYIMCTCDCPTELETAFMEQVTGLSLKGGLKVIK